MCENVDYTIDAIFQKLEKDIIVQNGQDNINA